MVFILNIHPNTSWYYSKFIQKSCGSDPRHEIGPIEEIKKMTSTNRTISPIDCGTYQLCIFYRIPVTSDTKEDINVLGSQFAQNAFNKRKWTRIRGTIIVAKFDLDGTCIDISFDDFFNVYKLYMGVKRISSRHKIRNFMSSVLSKIKRT